MPTPSREEIRRCFPALTSGFCFFENAGGSQVPQQVLSRINELMVKGCVQTGAGYPAADFVDKTVDDAKAFANAMVNGEGVGSTLIGPSTTALLHRLSDAIAHSIKVGDEVVVSIANHEANIGPWLKLQAQGAKILWWGIDPNTGGPALEELERLLTPRTKIVACAHTSNLLGDVLDVRAVADLAHAVGAQVVVDGVAFAPHQAIDVSAWDADFYAFSFYKVYAPHIAALFGKKEAWQRLVGPNHYFIPDDAFPWKFELGCQPYELLAGVLGLADYFAMVADRKAHDRETVTSAFKTIRELELPVQRSIQDFLVSRKDVRLLGTTRGDDRHPTFSFVHERIASDEVARRVNAQGVGIRNGHMYAKRLCEALGVPPEPGVVRVSAVHTNDPREVEVLISALERAFGD